MVVGDDERDTPQAAPLEACEKVPSARPALAVRKLHPQDLAASFPVDAHRDQNCLRLNAWPAPSARGDFWLALVSLLQRIRSRGFPGQDGDPRSPILIITAASRAVQWSRFSSCRSTVRPSSFHLTQTSPTRRRDERRSGNLFMQLPLCSRHHRHSRVPEPPRRCARACWPAPRRRYSCASAPAVRAPTGQEASPAQPGKVARRARHGSDSCEDSDCRVWLSRAGAACRRSSSGGASVRATPPCPVRAGRPWRCRRRPPAPWR